MFDTPFHVTITEETHTSYVTLHSDLLRGYYYSVECITMDNLLGNISSTSRKGYILIKVLICEYLIFICFNRNSPDCILFPVYVKKIFKTSHNIKQIYILRVFARVWVLMDAYFFRKMQDCIKRCINSNCWGVDILPFNLDIKI